MRLKNLKAISSSVGTIMKILVEMLFISMNTGNTQDGQKSKQSHIIIFKTTDIYLVHLPEYKAISTICFLSFVRSH